MCCGWGGGGGGGGALKFIQMFLSEMCNKVCTTIFTSDTTGPNLSIPLYGHSMVPLSNGQAILGGIFFIMDQAEWNPNIYFLTCSNLECNIQTMTKTASFLASYFVAIPIPDDMSGCIFRGKLI